MIVGSGRRATVEGVNDAGIELVVTDLDGTLWGADERIHDATLGALHALASRELPVLVATGRRLGSAVRTLARHDLTLPTVLLDGALGRDVESGRTFHRVAFTRAQAANVLATFRDAGLSPCVYVDRPDVEVVVDGSCSTHEDHLRNLGPWLERSDLEAVVGVEDVLTFAIVAGPSAAMNAVVRGIGDEGEAAVVRDVMYGGSTLLVRPAGVSKWAGVLAWCTDQNLDPTRVLAVGDGENDLDLLDGARIACVVSDGCAEALARAHHVIEPACDGGWSAILDLV